MVGGVFIVIVDSLAYKSSSSALETRIDWSSFIHMYALFVMLGSISLTKIPHWILNTSGMTDFSSLWKLILVCACITLISNLFHGVTVTLFLIDAISLESNSFELMLFLAWCTSIAGNFTLYANNTSLITTNQAKQTLNCKMNFRNHLRYGFPSSLIILSIGLLMIYGLLHV